MNSLKRMLAMLLTVSAMASLQVSAEGTVRVAVASNFLLPMKVLAQEYRKQGGNQVKISSGSTGKLYAQIINGAPFDMFFAANSKEPERLEKSGLSLPGTRYTYALGRVALWSAAADLPAELALKKLRDQHFKRLVIANPATAPYGQAAVSVLKALGLDEMLQDKLMTAENITQTYRYIATGNVELGFVAWSQLVAHKKQDRAWLVPEQYHPAIEQQSVLLLRAAQNTAAHDFFRFIKSQHAGELIQSFGYGLAESS